MRIKQDFIVCCNKYWNGERYAHCKRSKPRDAKKCYECQDRTRKAVEKKIYYKMKSNPQIILDIRL